ncbi:MAG: hypothetical protein AAFU73_15255 [Planctomycetota bacterium]
MNSSSTRPDVRTTRGPRARRATHAALIAALAASGALTGCSGSDGGLAGPQGPSTLDFFAVNTTNVLDGATWQLNRAIDIEFNRDVDFSTVSPSTVQIVDQQGVPAVGSFSQISPRVLRFQPTCPTDEDNSNGGLRQGRDYRLTIPSESTPGIGGGVTVQSTAGDRLTQGVAIEFFTPQSDDLLVLFVDSQAGAPSVRVRGLGVEPDGSMAGSFVEFPGLDSDDDGTADREFLVFDDTTDDGDPASQVGEIVRSVPLNLYSDAEQQFAFVLRFNQPVQGSGENINSQNIGIEYLNLDSGLWERVPSTVELLSNCTTIGAEVRVAPEGVVPQGSAIRAVVREGFTDLTGDALSAAISNFARVDSVLLPGGDGSDEILESFDVGGDAFGSREDIVTASANPRAAWNSDVTPGTLTASFDFGGTGGPGGDFDWVIPSGVDVILNTDADQILGGPDGIPINIQPVIGGVINVRDFIVREGASVAVIGSNTCTILATRNVLIQGTVSVNGSDSRGVGTLDTTNQPESGANGNAGGGDGGVGSFQQTQSTARGGAGEGAFGAPNLGGEGGETGYAPTGTCAKENRRGGGGGGGRLGEDVRYDWMGEFPLCQTLVGLDIERGIIGSLEGTGAVSQTNPAQGGAAGPSPFTDPNDENDFFGVITKSDGRQIRGELPSVWAGAGGGAGGDASTTAVFPITPFNIRGDEKGSGGGGGAGGLEILAIGPITVTGQGSITADGGTGNGGENTIFFDRVGGGSGGGSGGHIVLSSANQIVLDSEATQSTVGAFYQDSLTSLAHVKRPVRALGGQGGAGRESRCGANEEGEETWSRDSIPLENFEGFDNVPPQDPSNANGLLNWARLCTLQNHAGCASEAPPGETWGAGGDGGPGIIQLHVSDPTTQIVFGTNGSATGTYGAGADPTYTMSPPPLGWTRPTDPVDFLVPFFSARSESFTDWIPLGLARLNADGSEDQVEFLFGGTDPATGVVLREGGVGTTAADLAPLVAYTALDVGGGGFPSVDTSTGTFTFDNATGIDPTGVYRRNAQLMREFAMRLRDGTNNATVEEFTVQTAEYDVDNDRFLVTVDRRDTELADTLTGFAAPQVELVPFFFRLATAGQLDGYPTGTEVGILFDAAVANPVTGEPSADPALIFSGGDTAAFTPDVTNINTDPLNASNGWDFIRVKFEFLIDINQLNDPRPGLEFIKLPYLF